MALPSLKSFLAVGALMVAIPLAGAPAALAATTAPADVRVTVDRPVPGKIAIRAAAFAQTADEAANHAQAGTKKGLAEHEKRTGTKCKPIHESLAVKKQNDLYLAIAELHAICVKR
ncbi:hypothetical protein [Allokutzneria albata]|uniref:UrcA family protein n=1 Tax=Allokutzneria albata TaxID=211114 RepID=A0A1G9WZJ1_ALLAB|nr:hypothetical protein [Allokutzneria albata]SDM89868.1 hypothetical protein SAMN04489726_3901 [Allokutzneria albata]